MCIRVEGDGGVWEWRGKGMEGCGGKPYVKDNIFGWFSITKINTVYKIVNNCDLIRNLVVTVGS